MLSKQLAHDLWLDNNVYLGSKSGTSVTSSSSDITIRGNLFNFNGYNPYCDQQGTFTLEPVSTSTSFGQNVSTSWWSWNQNSHTLSGLTFGKSGNTRNITHETNALTVNGPVNFYGAAIYNNVAGQLSGSGSFTQTTGTLQIYTTGSSIYSGVIGGATSLTKTGSGTLVLSGANTYTGATSISAGTIRNGIAGACMTVHHYPLLLARPGI
jgi:autotransporter-associated beta strand protein